MRKMLLVTILFSAFAAAILSQLNCAKGDNEKEMSREELISYGGYLVNLGGCADCHSPKIMTEMGPVPDSSKFLSGHPAGSKLESVDTSVTSSKWMYSSMDLTAWAGPWGISYTANLTPDGPTGIGNWTEEIFMKALRSGKHMGFGRNILPPMPWQNYSKLKDEDLKAIFAYLKSLKPINNQVPEPVPPNMVTEKINQGTKM